MQHSVLAQLRLLCGYAEAKRKGRCAAHAEPAAAPAVPAVQGPEADEENTTLHMLTRPCCAC